MSAFPRLAFAMFCLGAAPSFAAPRVLDAPQTANWEHEGTHVKLPSAIGAFKRTTIRDFSADQSDVFAVYDDLASNSQITIYLFRPGAGSAAVWFDRAQASIEHRALFGSPAHDSARTRIFVPPGGKTASGLRATYSLSNSQYVATTLAALPIDNWLVVIRISSTSLDGTKLDQTMDQLFAAIGWPATIAAATAAKPITPCAKPLNFGAAKQPPVTAEQQIAAGMTAIGARDTVRQNPAYCRDGDNEATQALYQRTNSTSYILALNDSGRAISVEDITSDKGKPLFSVAYQDLSDGSVLPAFDRPPSPEQIFDAMSRGPTIVRVSLGAKGFEINIDPSFAK